MDLDKFLSMAKLSHYFCGECPLNTPSIFKPGEQATSVEPKTCGPFLDTQSLPVKFQPHLVFSVLSLLKRRLPPAVPWLVVAAVVLATHLMLGCRSLPDICKKINKPFLAAPSVTHENPSAAVPGIGRIVNVTTSLHYPRPGNVLRASSAAMCCRCPASCCRSFLAKAPTAISMASEIAPADINIFSTVA